MLKKESYNHPILDMKKTGQQIRKIMKEKGITVSMVRDELMLESTRTVYHWLEGRSLPAVDNLYYLARFLGVSVDVLLVSADEADEPKTGMIR